MTKRNIDIRKNKRRGGDRRKTRRGGDRRKTNDKKYTRKRIQSGGRCVLDTDGTFMTKPFIRYEKKIRALIDVLAKYFVWASQMVKTRFKSKKCTFDPSDISDQFGKFFGWGAFLTSNGSIRWPGIEPNYSNKTTLSFCKKKDA